MDLGVMLHIIINDSILSISFVASQQEKLTNTEKGEPIMRKISVIIFTITLIVLGNNFVFAQEQKAEKMMDQGQKILMPSMMQENMKMMGDLMDDMAKMMGESQATLENQKGMWAIVGSLGCIIHAMESGCDERALKKHKEELGYYQNEMEKMAKKLSYE
jgi:hypothetical protein